MTEAFRTLRLAVSLTLLGLACTVQARDLKIGIVFDPADPRYESKRLDKLYPGQAMGRPKAGAELAIAESAFQLEQANLRVMLEEVPAASARDARAQIEALAKKGVRHFLADLPGSSLTELSKTVAGQDVLLFNVSAPEARLRREACAANLFHTLPDDAMRSDAIAQFLTVRKWNKVLLLTSTLADDQPAIGAARQAIKRYGLKLAAVKTFKLSNDPREHDLGNVALLTAGIDADVIWVVDPDGEFARQVPYASVAPRPVVGSAGLVPEAWHASWERHGAPQLNRRFRKASGRWMSTPDWAAWMATKAIVDVALRSPDSREHQRMLRGADLVLDGFKGARLSFRPWDQQLRQPIFLAHGGIGGGIAGVAPFDGFLHAKNNLDTLGADERESACSAMGASSTESGKQ
ncbi:ABC transporter substrate-binding protein [Herbaspirillum sp. GCM10030257]|uniref:ABC transporter substrate-binding protein n=1 Tax=Herbaspirillum sp. GCM10030257 TaxID=3273393 RepID=UPI00361B2D9D